MTLDLEHHLRAHIVDLGGAWIAKNSHYERELAHDLGMSYEAGRYWDARWFDQAIEMKKGTSIWLDLLRYAEILQGQTEAARTEVLTLFFRPTSAKDAIAKIACVETSALHRVIGLTPADATSLIALAKKLPRQLNAQASLTWKDIGKIATFVVSNDTL